MYICHSYYSFKYGTISPRQLLQIGQSSGIKYMALADINTTSGILDFFRLAPQYNIVPIAAVDFRLHWPSGKTLAFTAMAINADGFLEINNFLTAYLTGQTEATTLAPCFNHVFVFYPFAQTQLLPSNLRRHEFIAVNAADVNKLTFSIWHKHPHKLVAWQAFTFRHKTDFNTHRLLRAIHYNTLLSKLHPSQHATLQACIVPAQTWHQIFIGYPQLIKNLQQLMEQCHIDFEFGINKNKKIFSSSARQDYHQLLSLCYDGLKYRYPQPTDAITDRFEKEIKMITELGFSSYFLINHDIVKYAQHKGYFYIGRGSGANSMVAYLLRITDVDPIDLDLYFERFINASRTSPPDFDIDFSWNERDDVIRYIFEKHGATHTALLATYSTFQSRAVLRELGKVFGLPKAEIDLMVDNRKHPDTPDHITKLIQNYALRIHDMPSHLSIHAGGILIAEKPIHYYTATQLPPKDFPITQFSMLEAEDVGLYKFDILSQRGLGKIKDAVVLVKQNQNITIDIHEIKKFKTDSLVRNNLKTANLMGCYYVESPAMRMLLTKLKAETYLDLVAASSIIRPGVSASGMMREYILRFHDASRRTYAHPLLKNLMAETFGVMVYQEDVIKVAHHFAGLTLTEADMLRRGMSGKYRGRDEFKKVETRFFENCNSKGYPPQITAEVWRQIESFAGYAFSKGHSASYAVESYQCMFLKTYYPLEFMVAVINNGGGFFSTQFYVHEARQCGGIIEAPHINNSHIETTIKNQTITLGFNLVAELTQQVMYDILLQRKYGAFTSLSDFVNRVSISIEQLRLLIRVGAFRFTARTKKQLLWDIHTLVGASQKSNAMPQLFDNTHKNFELPALHYHKLDDALDEIELLGFPLCNPFLLLKQKTNVSFIATHFSSHFNKVVTMVGYLVTTKTSRTKQGQTMFFATWLDSQGRFFDTTHFPVVAQQYPIRGRGCYSITGRIAHEFGFYSLDVISMNRLDFVTYADLAPQNDTINI